MADGGQVWHFAENHGHVDALAGQKAAIDGLLDEGKASLAKLASVWGGSGSEAYQAVQQRWDNTALELNNALLSLAHAIGSSNEDMAGVESGVTGSFG
ncbi:WXG100 family type VII secretion target [Mycolicibacterium sp. lyk4-40-TYG-92]|uniref:WXG100 family type VII secretion target n=1 Tax=Mycolicibacterium sp. lyk4-40-TYG-92 TaxID=3040295 RepID=UPI00254F4833|nr:WXG100 family type VII secretion target [Mycolicibacterium sp. lyk4-40-TYG-92]